MIELVVIYCLTAVPPGGKAECVERRDETTSYDSVAACLAQGQIVAEQYLQTHPKWRLLKFSCEIDKPRQEPA